MSILKGGLTTHSFTTMDKLVYTSGDYVCFPEAECIAFEGLSRQHYDADVAEEIFRKAASTYPMILENCRTFFILSYAIPRSDLDVVFNTPAILSCMQSRLDAVVNNIKNIPDDNAREISIQENLAEEIREKIAEKREGVAFGRVFQCV
jgi:hypothetical protein